MTDLSTIEFWNATCIYVGRIPVNQKWNRPKCDD